ncbi:hypothetical protein D3C87_1880690 [compost metagenome]
MPCRNRRGEFRMKSAAINFSESVPRLNALNATRYGRMRKAKVKASPKKMPKS